ncbi:alpha/beta hydrolase [Winogradskyella maritima]|uniref:Alpha/beta hydrolase n=1 Tax=Winogradskyella maritima TaxID=1517766 RepID=A0ABV8AML0_9FLAO|nr:alpha/beta hydrolase [Winogradskyella maritima]
MKFFQLTLLLLLAPFVSAQTLYLDDSFSEIEVSTHTYQKKKKDSFQLDFYRPKTTSEKLPLLLYVHGGGFSGGQRDDPNSVEFATKMAKKGYAVISMSYELTMKKLGFGCDTKTEKKIEAFDSVADDIVSAINYILKEDKVFNINKDQIVLAGTSAGAEAVLHLVYVKQKTDLPRKFQFAGVIGMAGAIIGLENLNTETAIPTQLFHGTNDNLVPYHIASHHYCSPDDKGYMMLYGSRAIADKLKGLGKSYFLFSINGGTHSWSGLPMRRCIAEVTDFLYYDVLQKSNRQTERVIGL